ncbi:NADP-dependent succinic semialdehyde dehydrogenase [Catellatospora citrea]|uniref:Succinate-semialdehyde dehydrogenase n=1 Tax=Catellatospora citrea TaxID=53366 RepID=A0A8J3P4G5_9ACTN|nr:NADP-dependent succinic semialdehyde dehydrogenase [Catellatospora citrea]RKE10702.1 succinate-semialdehyde dehydrogenase/glutarate-semialdehyde dehydrogenase [Catellatospora citrea]GIG01166.1 succinate-semialdehyde dehydrogenase [Catellatospora citrea]
MPIATINPATGETLKTFQAYDDAEIERRLTTAVDAAAALRQTPIGQRAKWMHAAADAMQTEAEDLARMLTLEMGKPITQARAEVDKCIRSMRFEADHAHEFLADQPLSDPGAVGASKAWTTWQPLGVVLAVMPWNFPLWQVMRFAAPALMAGNAGLLKHASNVPQAALYLGSLFAKGGFPDGAFQALLISSSAVAPLIADERVAAITITGSEPAGREVATTAGRNIKKTVLELGGSDPFIVMAGVDLDAASSTAVHARVQNNGQSCIAAKRFIIDEPVYEEFVERFTAKMKALRIGDPMDESTEVGPLATESGRDELDQLVQDAAGKGAEVLAGGAKPDNPGWFYPPTVLAGLTDDMRIVTEEAFGPVASVYRVSGREEAVRVANQTSFGLSSAVWSADAEEQAWFVGTLDAGAVFINGMSESSAQLPFGGVKNSGYGREMGSAGIREFCNLKAVWKA